MNIESCMVIVAAKSPQSSYMKGSFDLSVLENDYSIPEKINLNVNLVAGSYQILDLTTSFDMNEKNSLQKLQSSPAGQHHSMFLSNARIIFSMDSSTVPISQH